jgi:transposase
MTIGRNSLSKAETVTITAIETGVPRLAEARETIAAFQAMARNKTDDCVAMWIEAARSSWVASFASGVAKDESAVRAAITLPWSNGQTEGQITKLKLVKRQMYDVWASQDRFTSGSTDRRSRLRADCTKIGTMT